VTWVVLIVSHIAVLVIGFVVGRRRKRMTGISAAADRVIRENETFLDKMRQLRDEP